MNDIAIRVEGLSKQYRIGGKQERYKTFRDTVADMIKAPFRRVKPQADDIAMRNEEETIWALKDVSFEVKRGEVVGIIGRNGAGKSTLLKILSRITEPTSGYADIYGRLGSLLEVGTGFHPELTGRENIYLNGAIIGMKRAEIVRKFDEIVAFAEVEKFIDTPVKHYSSGMYLRLAFAVAAHMEPEILLVDEVLAVGDVQFQKKCLGKMGDVAKEGRTVLLVSHNMAAVTNLCRISVLLDKGRLSAHDETDKVISQYLADNAYRATTSLAERKDRSGNGRVRIQDINLLDLNNTATSVAQSGKPITFALHYSSADGKPIYNGLFEIKVTDNLGQLLFTLSTFLTGESFDQLPENGTVFCQVPHLLLAPGVYNTRLVCYANNELADLVSDAFQFTVIETDYLGGGKIVHSKTYGAFLMPQKWFVKT